MKKILIALKIKVFIVFMLNFCKQELRKCLPKPVKVAFLNKDVLKPLSSFVILTSKNYKELLDSEPTVNLM